MAHPQDILTSAVTICIFLASVIGIVNGVSVMRERWSRSSSQVNEKAISTAVAPRSPTWLADVRARICISSCYMFRQEVVLIVGISVLLNYVGLAISIQLSSVFYLDMTGTALGAFLLGPWWGATIGLVSNFVNWFLYPPPIPAAPPAPGPAITVFPWLMVNMAGGLFWGFLARRKSFRQYLSSTENSSVGHVHFLLKFGVLGAVLMAAVGTCVHAALGEQGDLSLNPTIAEAINRLLVGAQNSLAVPLTSLLGLRLGHALAWGIPAWLQNCLRYIPDKTISAAIALGLVRYGLPLFQTELIVGGANKKPPVDNWVSPATTAVIFAPFFLALMSVGIYRPRLFWPLWAMPWLAICTGIAVSLMFGPSAQEVAHGRLRRAEVYRRGIKGLRLIGADQFPRGLSLATLLASILFVLWLPLLGIPLQSLYRAVLNFFCVIYGSLFGLKIIFIMVRQNIAISRIGLRQPRAGVAAIGDAISPQGSALIEFHKPAG